VTSSWQLKLQRRWKKGVQGPNDLGAKTWGENFWPKILKRDIERQESAIRSPPPPANPSPRAAQLLEDARLGRGMAGGWQGDGRGIAGKVPTPAVVNSQSTRISHGPVNPHLRLSFSPCGSAYACACARVPETRRQQRASNEEPRGREGPIMTRAPIRGTKIY
jgi:hypothetical protein